MNGRKELALLVPAGGTFVELGVAAGKYAVEVLTVNPTMQYIGVDRWSDHHDEIEMINAQEKVLPFDSARLIRMTFKEALPLFDDESIDIVYLDGYAHTGQEGGETIYDWWGKVKSGGIMAGHDYCKEYQPTIDAVNAFVDRENLNLHIIEDNPYASWMVKKP